MEEKRCTKCGLIGHNIATCDDDVFRITIEMADAIIEEFYSTRPRRERIKYPDIRTHRDWIQRFGE